MSLRKCGLAMHALKVITKQLQRVKEQNEADDIEDFPKMMACLSGGPINSHLSHEREM